MKNIEEKVYVRKIARKMVKHDIKIHSHGYKINEQMQFAWKYR